MFRHLKPRHARGFLFCQRYSLPQDENQWQLLIVVQDLRLFPDAASAHITPWAACVMAVPDGLAALTAGDPDGWTSVGRPLAHYPSHSADDRFIIGRRVRPQGRAQFPGAERSPGG
jgi:hypothetical protein